MAPDDDRRPQSGLEALEYDEQSRTLLVRFKSGRVYRYQGVPASVYRWLERVPAKNAVFNRLVREHYDYQDVTRPESSVELTEALRASLRHESDTHEHD